MKQKALTAALMLITCAFFSCKKETVEIPVTENLQKEITTKEKYPYKSYSSAGKPITPEIEAFLKRIDSIPDLKERQAAMKKLLNKQSVKTSSLLQGQETYYDDYTFDETAWTLEGPFGFLYPQFDSNDSYLDYVQWMHGSILGSKRVNWKVVKQTSGLWVVWSQEKCYYQSAAYEDYKLVGVKHVYSYVEAVCPADWQEDFNQVMNYGYGIHAECRGTLTVFPNDAEGSPLRKSYQLGRWAIISNSSIIYN